MILALKIPKAGSQTLQTFSPQHIEEEYNVLQVWEWSTAVNALRCITSTDRGRSLKAFSVGQLVTFSGSQVAVCLWKVWWVILASKEATRTELIFLKTSPKYLLKIMKEIRGLVGKLIQLTQVSAYPKDLPLSHLAHFPVPKIFFFCWVLGRQCSSSVLIKFFFLLLPAVAEGKPQKDCQRVLLYSLGHTGSGTLKSPKACWIISL